MHIHMSINKSIRLSVYPSIYLSIDLCTATCVQALHQKPPATCANGAARLGALGSAVRFMAGHGLPWESQGLFFGLFEGDVDRAPLKGIKI